MILLNFLKWNQLGYIDKKGKCKTYKRIKIFKYWTPFVWVKTEKGHK